MKAKSLEEELYKLKASRSVEDLQKKELEEQLEAEQYFSTLYKTQVITMNYSSRITLIQGGPSDQMVGLGWVDLILAVPPSIWFYLGVFGNWQGD